MPFVEHMGTLLEGLEVGDPLQIYITKDGVSFRKLIYNPKNQLFTDYGWIHRFMTKARQKSMKQTNLMVFFNK